MLSVDEEIISGHSIFWTSCFCVLNSQQTHGIRSVAHPITNLKINIIFISIIKVNPSSVGTVFILRQNLTSVDVRFWCLWNVFIRQNLTSVDVRFWRIKTVPVCRPSLYVRFWRIKKVPLNNWNIYNGRRHRYSNKSERGDFKLKKNTFSPHGLYRNIPAL